MRVGILTFHDAANHGAFLQTYSLMKAVEGMGHEAWIIDYTNPSQRFRPYWPLLFPGTWLHVASYLKRTAKWRALQRAQRTKLRLTRSIDSREELGDYWFDRVIIGSDIVWDFVSPRLGRDPVYFGHYLRAGRVVSYAPSIGPAPADVEIPDYVRTGLEKFGALSVRDEFSRDMVRRACGRDAAVVLDPAFLEDFDGSEVLPREENFLLVYAPRSSLRPSEIRKAIEFASQRRLKTIAVAYEQKWCDKYVAAMDPFVWLGYFRKAACVLSATFHGTVFAIKYNKRFAVSVNDSIRQKTLPLLERLGLMGRVLADPESAASTLATPVDYESVNDRLGRMIGDSLDFLRRAIHD